MGPTYHNTLKLGTLLHEYRLESMLGAGGFGLTYLAWDAHLEKNVAIKEYLPNDLAVRALDGSVVPVSTDHDYDYKWGLDRFLLEARTLAKFSHAHIVRVNRYFEANGTAYMVMDYEEGESLNQLLKRVPQIPEDELRAILLPLLDGLNAVHEAGFLHRDIKPSNIFIRSNGSPVLLDFGAARHSVVGQTKSLTAVLTPGYAPIEQYTSVGRQGPWSDLYALSGVVFRAMTGQSPPDAVSRMQDDKLPQLLNPARQKYSERLVNAVRWGLAIQHADRPQRVADWKNVLTTLAPIPTGPATQPPGVAAMAPRQPGITSVNVVPPAATPARTQPTYPRRSPEPEPSGWMGRWGWVVAVLAVVSGVAWTNVRTRDSAVTPDPAVARRPMSPERPAPAVESPATGVVAATDAPRADPAYLPPASVSPDPAPPSLAVPHESAPPPPTPRETSFDRPERDRNVKPGDFSRSDLSQIERIARQEFSHADINADGYLSPNESARFPVLHKDFQRVDRDGDGRVSPDEFVQLRRMQAEALRSRLSK